MRVQKGSDRSDPYVSYGGDSSSDLIRPTSDNGSPRMWRSTRGVGSFTCGLNKIAWIFAIFVSALLITGIWNTHHIQSVGLPFLFQRFLIVLILIIPLLDDRVTVRTILRIHIIEAITQLTSNFSLSNPQNQSITATLIPSTPSLLISIVALATSPRGTYIQLSLLYAATARICLRL